MTLVTRSGKGSLLTHSEMDGNLTYLRDLGRKDFMGLKSNPINSELLTLKSDPVTASENLYNPDRVVMDIGGTTASVPSYPIFIMDNGVFVFEVDGFDENSYFVAMTLDSNNNYIYRSKVNISNLPNYSNYGWNWTYRNSGETNQVKLVNYLGFDEWPSRTAGSYVLTFTYNVNNNNLSASESVYNTNMTFDDLFDQETLQLDTNELYKVSEPRWNSNDDWCGMMDGQRPGWVWYKRSASSNQKYLGYNLLTGSYQVIDLENGITYGSGLSGVTNIIYSGSEEFSKIKDSINVYSHSKYGIIATFNTVGSGEQSVIKPTGIWSPYYSNITKATILTIRYHSDATLIFTDGKSGLDGKETYISELTNDYFYSATCVTSGGDRISNYSSYYYMSRVKLDSLDYISNSSTPDWKYLYADDVVSGDNSFNYWVKENSVIFCGVSSKMIFGNSRYDHFVVWKDYNDPIRLSAQEYPHHITNNQTYTYGLISNQMFASNLRYTYLDDTF